MIHRTGSLALLAACASTAFAAVPASARLLPGSSTTGHRASASRVVRRTWKLALSPQPNDLALAQISFRRAKRNRSVSPSALKLAAAVSFGDDYLAAATPLMRTPGELRILVLLVNRPSALLDPTTVRLGLSAPRSLGAPTIWKLSDPLGQPKPGLTPALCDLPIHGTTLTGTQLRPLRSLGAGLSGFDPASAVAEAYDVACGLPVDQAFEVDVRGSQTSPPTPTPPPQPPGCTPCMPTPGYACPLAQPSICAAPVADIARRASAGAH
ncbi:MAG TPA: hypothetical protein VFD88_07485 [Clostridia bacterium]|nr:hypothetical protein [Clostridia bacterium]